MTPVGLLASLPSHELALPTRALVHRVAVRLVHHVEHTSPVDAVAEASAAFVVAVVYSVSNSDVLLSVG